MVLDGGRDRSLIEDAIPDEPIDAVIDLGQERRHWRWVLLLACRPRGGDNPTLGIYPTLLLDSRGFCSYVVQEAERIFTAIEK
jgi:hypothetical protein